MATLSINRFLTDDGLVGDGTNQEANRNGSVTAVPFYAGPPAGKVWEVHRMLITVSDNAVLVADNYGGADISGGTGVSVEVREGVGGTLLQDLCDGSNVKSFVDWASFCYDVTDHSFGSGDNFLTARWTFAKTGRPIVLDSTRNEVIQVTINDNLSVLTGHRFMIQGVERDDYSGG
jgi:hypothetical protein